LNVPPPPLAELTVNVTGTLVLMPLPVMVIVPLNVPAVRPVMLEDTVSVAGVVPVAGETCSHDAPLAVALKVAFGLALTARVCEAGEAPPAVAEKESVPGLTLSVDAGLTVNVTGTVTVWPLATTLMVPVKVPAFRSVTLEDTVSAAGVVPVAGETFSHDAPLAVAL
jgi:hypothetical protein